MILPADRGVCGPRARATPGPQDPNIPSANDQKSIFRACLYFVLGPHSTAPLAPQPRGTFVCGECQWYVGGQERVTTYWCVRSQAGLGLGREEGQAVAWAGCWLPGARTFWLPLQEVLEFLNLHLASQTTGKEYQGKRGRSYLV